MLSGLFMACALLLSSCDEKNSPDPPEDGDEMVDDGVTIWDDTHWRAFQLKGKVKTLVDNEEDATYTFNSNGKLVEVEYENFLIEKYEYNTKGQLIKLSYNYIYDYIDDTRSLSAKKQNKFGKNILFAKTRAADATFLVIEFEYGNHSKYLPVMPLGDVAENFMVKGLTSMKVTGEEVGEISYNFKINDSSIELEGSDGSSAEIKYSGNYPQKMIAVGEDEEGSYKEETEIKYGKNYKYSELILTSSRNHTEIIRYVIDETIYLLEKEYEYTEEGITDLYKMEYDSKGRLILKGYDSFDAISYINYVEDIHRNWTERTASYPDFDLEKETRVITYFN